MIPTFCSRQAQNPTIAVCPGPRVSIGMASWVGLGRDGVLTGEISVCEGDG